MNATDHLFSSTGAAELTARQIADVERNYGWAYSRCFEAQREDYGPRAVVASDPNQMTLLPPTKCQTCGVVGVHPYADKCQVCVVRESVTARMNHEVTDAE